MDGENAVQAILCFLPAHGVQATVRDLRVDGVPWDATELADSRIIVTGVRIWDTIPGIALATG